MILSAQIALIFDMDNTVLGSRIDFAAIRRALGAMLREVGATDESDDALRRYAIGELVARGAVHDADRGTAMVPRMWEIITAHETEGLRDAAALDGAPDVLAALRARGYRLAILTNNSRTGASLALEAAGLALAAETVVTRDDVPTMKPASDGVLEALRRLGGAPPADSAAGNHEIKAVYVIGDSWIDGAAAQGAGARFIAYRRGFEELWTRGLRPWRAITHLRELLAIDFGASGEQPGPGRT